jgi:reactive intermediate/imine deaminase
MADKRQIIVPKNVHPAVGYSHAVRKGGLLCVSGQVAIDQDGNVVGVGDFRAQAEQVFRNLKAVIEAAGGTMNDILKTTTFITDIANRPLLAEVREKFYGPEPPASTLVVISSLVRPELLIEVEAIVALDEGAVA